MTPRPAERPFPRRRRGRNVIRYRITAAVTAALAALSGLAISVQIRAGGDKVGFPENYAKGVMYTTVDRPDLKQYREFFTTPATLAALRQGDLIPSGAVLTMAQCKAKLDAQGNPIVDSNGRFVKGDLAGYTVMEKRSGWGSQYPVEVRNGEWEYQAFTADNKINDKRDLTECFQCHKPLEKQDYVFTYDKLKSAATK